MVLQKDRLKYADKDYAFRWTYIELNNKEITAYAFSELEQITCVKL